MTTCDFSGGPGGLMDKPFRLASIPQYSAVPVLIMRTLSPTRRFMRFGLCAVALLLLTMPATAQEDAPARPAGTVTLTDWPDTLAAAADDFAADAYQLLPQVEALSVEYRYAGTPRGVDLSFVLSWAPGDEGLYEGRVQPVDQLPPDLRMVEVELLADVIVAGRDVADMMIAVDSMALPSHPSVYAFEVAELAYDAVFLDTPADSARQYVEEGFTLRNLAVNRIAFASFADRPPRAEPEVAQDAPTPSTRPRPPRSVYVPRTGIFIGWRVGPDPYYVGPGRTRRAEQPRGESVGRSTAETDRQEQAGRGERAGADTPPDAESTRDDASGRAEQGGRSGQRGSRDEDDRDDEDDEDEDSLLPASAAALAAVGAAAVIGGTVGVHGTGRTPIGLMAGRVVPRGGGLLQASINPAVLEADGRQHLEAKLVGFYDVFGAPVQPAVGLGALATAEGDATEVEPSVSLGLVGNFGRVVVMGGVDVVQGTPEFGLAINFRFNPDQ